jgi:hypothetical protein
VDSIFTMVFGKVQRFTGTPDQRIRIPAMLRQRAYPDRHGHSKLPGQPHFARNGLDFFAE